MPISEIVLQLSGRPILLISVILTAGVIIVNGWTDAPSAIATCISTGAMSPRKAILMAAVMNFFGVFIMSKINGRVAATIFNLVDLSARPEAAATALCAAMCAIILWAVAAWFFGIPTSESHALTAGLTGAAVGINKSFKGVSGSEWSKVLFGLVLSTVLGFVLGFLAAKGIERLLKGRGSDSSFSALQRLSAGLMAFMHGAQDGQKFIGVFMLAVSLSTGEARQEFTIPVWLIILTSLLMAAGTSMGGMRIINKIGSGMVKLTKSQGFSADLAGAVCLLISTVAGLPVSTTHTKTTAIMGVGAAKSLSEVNSKVVKELFLAWGLTFPGCGFLGYLTSQVFILLLK